MALAELPTGREGSEHPALAHPMFAGIDRERVRPLLAGLRPRPFRAGEAVQLPGSRRPSLHLLLSGRLCLFELTTEGRRVILDYIEPGGMEGLLAVAGLRGHFAEACAPSRVLSIGRDLLDQLVAAEPRIAVNLLWAMTHAMQRREEQLERITVRDPSQRLAGQLLALAEAFGNDQRAPTWVGPRLSHESLADMLGLRRETVTLHLGRLRTLGAVRVAGDQFVLNRSLLVAVRDGQGPH